MRIVAFICLWLATAILPSFAQPQQGTKTHRIGVIYQGTAVQSQLLDGLRRGLAEGGLVERKNYCCMYATLAAISRGSRRRRGRW